MYCGSAFCCSGGPFYGTAAFLVCLGGGDSGAVGVPPGSVPLGEDSEFVRLKAMALSVVESVKTLVERQDASLSCSCFGGDG